jgi:hypothetical protein
MAIIRRPLTCPGTDGLMWPGVYVSRLGLLDGYAGSYTAEVIVSRTPCKDKQSLNGHAVWIEPTRRGLQASESLYKGMPSLSPGEAHRRDAHALTAAGCGAPHKRMIHTSTRVMQKRSLAHEIHTRRGDAMW